MLLIDTRGNVRSLAPHHSPVPFMREWLRHDLPRIQALFRRCRTDHGFIQALREELQTCLAWVPTAQPYPDALSEAAERAIADGLIGVASVLPDGVTVAFDNDRPSEWDGLTPVVFADLAIAERFVASALKVPESQAAFEAALAHPLSQRYFAATSTKDAMGPGGRAPDDAASLASRAAVLLSMRQLGLVPRDPSRRVLWLVWLEHGVPPASKAGSPAPVSRSVPPPPPPPVAAPASTLPDAPDDVSPQAQTLINAAKDGTPFCEECARRAAELANA